jgi:signal transduction histidine kinase
MSAGRAISQIRDAIGRLRFSLRLKLALWMVLLFLVVQLSLVLVLQFYQRRSIDEFFDARLASRVDQVASEIAPRISTLNDAELYALASEYKRFSFNPFITIEVFDESGRSIAASREPRSTLSEDVLHSVKPSTGPTPIAVTTAVFAEPNADSARASAKWVAGSDGRRYLVMFAWSDMYAQQVLRLLFGVVVFSIPIGVLAMIVSAYAISGVAIQPIRAMRQMARSLEPEHLSERVTIGRADSELESLRQDFENTRSRLEAAFSAQERFMSNVSHELKTPIAVILTEAQTLKLDGLNKDVKAFVASTSDELDKLARMVDSFLMLTRVRHGKAKMPRNDQCYARDIMVQSYESCLSMAAQHGVRLSIRLPEDEVDAGVLGNCDLLCTVLENIIRNAIRFSPRGAAVEVVGDADTANVQIHVRDSGPGIPADVLPRIFDRFAQTSEEQRRGRGHGLGLEIAMGITELHGGTIAASNRPGGGCEFTIRLPLAQMTEKALA